jgi:sulfatase modifying factor 1
MPRLRFLLPPALVVLLLPLTPCTAGAATGRLHEGRAPGAAAPAPRAVQQMIAIPAGAYRPLYGRAGDAATRVAAFRLDRDPVTRGDFLAFVRANPQWRRSVVRPLHADRAGYLADWRGDLDVGSALDLRRPAAGVSWFAARAYCAWRSGRLPTVAEWEYVAAASATRRDAVRDGVFMQQLVSLYASRSRPLSPVDSGAVNAYGVRGLHGLAWEWVADFNSVLVSDDSRGVGGRDHDLFCASAAIGAADPTNYPAFLRYALRAGLSGRSTLETLGFRCAA